MTIALTDRDRALVRAAWSLGAATHATLRALVSPQTDGETLRRRMRQLHRAGYLAQTRHVGPAGCLWLYSVGRKGLAPGEPRPWRPGVAQVEHTVAVGDVLVALTRSGFVAPLVVVNWQGEAELRAWARPGDPFPDARIVWSNDGIAQPWLVEVDRATESRTSWRRKLVRYLAADIRQPILAVTTSERRATGLAAEAAEVGVDIVATTVTDVRYNPDPVVVDAAHRRRSPLTEAAEARAGRLDAGVQFLRVHR
jgi:hypothetical protein